MQANYDKCRTQAEQDKRNLMGLQNTSSGPDDPDGAHCYIATTPIATKVSTPATQQNCHKLGEANLRHFYQRWDANALMTQSPTIEPTEAENVAVNASPANDSQDDNLTADTPTPTISPT